MKNVPRDKEEYCSEYKILKTEIKRLLKKQKSNFDIKRKKITPKTRKYIKTAKTKKKTLIL